MSRTVRIVLAALATLAAFVVLYRHVLVKLVHDWATDGNYSHGFLIVPIALYFAWERRVQIKGAPRQPSVVGGLVVAGSLVVLATGLLGAELFLTRISILGVLAGAVLFVGRWADLRILGLPLALPLPVGALAAIL